MLPRGVKIGLGFLTLYLGLIVFLLANVVILFVYDEVPAVSPLDPLMYLGLIVMILGPVWFWVLRPIYYATLREEVGEGTE